jgi:hypothetical protein
MSDFIVHYVFIRDIETGLYIFMLAGTEAECYQFVQDNHPHWVSNISTPEVKIMRDC